MIPRIQPSLTLLDASMDMICHLFLYFLSCGSTTIQDSKTKQKHVHLYKTCMQKFPHASTLTHFHKHEHKRNTRFTGTSSLSQVQYIDQTRVNNSCVNNISRTLEVAICKHSIVRQRVSPFNNLILNEHFLHVTVLSILPPGFWWSDGVAITLANAVLHAISDTHIRTKYVFSESGVNRAIWRESYFTANLVK